MATQTLAPRPATDLPRAVLRADGVLVGVGGALLLAAARPLGPFLGVDSPLVPIALGAACLPYAAWLLRSANRRTIARGAVLTAALVNTAWVLGSAALLLGGTPALTAGGRWAVAIVAGIVALCAVAQFSALRRLR